MEDFEEKPPSVEELDKEFLASQTWRNLRITVSGFLAYARAILTSEVARENGIEYVPMMHSHTSRLESFFSRMRARNNDTANTYASGLSFSVNNVKANKVATRNSSQYENDWEEKIYELQDLPQQELLAKLREDERILSEMQEGLTEAMERRAPQKPARLETDIAEGSINVRRITEYVKEQLHSKSFIQHTLGNRNFRYWYGNLATLSSALGEGYEKLRSRIEEDCQEVEDSLCRLHQFIFLEIKKNLQMPLKQRKDDIEIRLFHTDKSGLLKDVEGILPKDNPAKEFMFHVLFETTFDIQSSIIKQYAKETLSQHTGPGQPLRVPNNSNVQRLVGWAIHSMEDKLSKEMTRSSSNTKVNSQLEILQKMRLKKAEVDADYESKYYTLEDRILDKGGLTLVHGDMFPWGLTILQAIRRNVNHETISKLQCQVLKHAWHSLNSNEDLLGLFKEGVGTLGVDISDAVLEELHESLLKKVFHAEANFEVTKFARNKLESASGKDGSQVNFRTQLKCSSETKRQRDASDETKRNTRKRQKTHSN